MGTIKTYGVYNLVDWQATIRAGKANVVVHFSGGALTAYGVTPAEYTTGNPFFQSVIEGSDLFKRGRIVLLRELAMAERAERGRTVGEADASQKIAERAERGDSVGEADASQENSSAPEAMDALIDVEVSCLQDAVDYLNENYGVSRAKVRNRDTALRLGSEYGVRFNFT